LHFPGLWFTLLAMKKGIFARSAGRLAGCACLLALFSWRLLCETLTYREVEGEAAATHVLVIAPEASGFQVTLLTTRPAGEVRQTFRTDAGLATLAWTFSDPARRLELAAHVQGAEISGGKRMSFRSIGTEGPGELKLGKFTVTRQGDETIGLGGKEVVAVRLRVSLSGLLSVFWHGDYWFRRGDGRFLRYRGKNHAGGPVAVSELAEEKPDEKR
jgi:hypothetical protein